MVGSGDSKPHPTASISKHVKPKCPDPSPIPTPTPSTSTDIVPTPETATPSSFQDITTS